MKLIKPLYQTSLDQTGMAIIELNNSDEYKYVPLFSEKPCEEAKDLESYIPHFKELKHVFLTNNLLDYKIEDSIKEYMLENNNIIPEDLMDELIMGFPFIEGSGLRGTMLCYK